MNLTRSKTVEVRDAASTDSFGTRNRRRSHITVRQLAITLLLMGLIAAVSIPMLIFQVVNSQTSRLQSDLSAAAAVIIASREAGNAVPTMLPAGLASNFAEFGSVKPAQTLTVHGNARRGTLCIEGKTRFLSRTWSYNMEAGGLVEAPCPR